MTNPIPPPPDAIKCLTPGSVYSLGADGSGNVLIKVAVPHGSCRCQQYVRGEFGVTIDAAENDRNKLARYDQMYAERDRVLARFHDALEPVIADLYRTIWPLALAGKEIDGEIMPTTYDEYLGNPLRFLDTAPRDGTYIEITTNSAVIRNVYWCDDASDWAQDGRVFNPELPSKATWRLMEEPV